MNTIKSLMFYIFFCYFFISKNFLCSLSTLFIVIIVYNNKFNFYVLFIFFSFKWICHCLQEFITKLLRFFVVKLKISFIFLFEGPVGLACHLLSVVTRCRNKSFFFLRNFIKVHVFHLILRISNKLCNKTLVWKGFPKLGSTGQRWPLKF